MLLRASSIITLEILRQSCQAVQLSRVDKFYDIYNAHIYATVFPSLKLG